MYTEHSTTQSKLLEMNRSQADGIGPIFYNDCDTTKLYKALQ